MSMNQVEEFDIFNLSIDDVKLVETKKDKVQLYNVDPKKSSDNVRRAIIRFMPNLFGGVKGKSIVRKYSYWLPDPEGGNNGFYADCPSSVEEKSIIADTYWRLKNSKSALDQKRAESLKRSEYFYSYVLIVKDSVFPELEGTIQVFRYPKSIKKMIDAQLTPDAKDSEFEAVEPVQIFDPLHGKDFMLKVVIKGDYWNYDECKFANSISPASIKGVKIANDAESRKLVMSLYENVPNLSDFEFKPWSSDLHDRVVAYLANLTGTRVTPAMVDKTSSIPSIESAKSAAVVTSLPEVDETDDDIDQWIESIKG